MMKRQNRSHSFTIRFTRHERIQQNLMIIVTFLPKFHCNICSSTASFYRSGIRGPISPNPFHQPRVGTLSPSANLEGRDPYHSPIPKFHSPFPKSHSSFPKSDSPFPKSHSPVPIPQPQIGRPPFPIPHSPPILEGGSHSPMEYHRGHAG